MAGDLTQSGEDADRMLGTLNGSTEQLSRSAGTFASTMTKAFSSSVAGGKQFDDVLKSLTQRSFDFAQKFALRPFEGILSNGPKGIVGTMLSGIGSITPFASGGVIGSPTYFPLGGGMGLAGEAGPEAIMPLKRGVDGRLGVAADGAGSGSSVVVNIATPDADSFRRSESYVAGQIARAVARGQRSL